MSIVLTSNQIREIEQRAINMGMSGLRLMENAGSAAAKEIRDKFTDKNLKIVILCGKGNNGNSSFSHSGNQNARKNRYRCNQALKRTQGRGGLQGIQYCSFHHRRNSGSKNKKYRPTKLLLGFKGILRYRNRNALR